jgi:hypothetical protein
MLGSARDSIPRLVGGIKYLNQMNPWGLVMKTSIGPNGEVIVKAAPKPYGDVEYADPAEGKYPIDTEEHIRAAWNYVNKPKNAGILGSKLSSIKSKIISAWKKVIDPKGPPSAAK